MDFGIDDAAELCRTTLKGRRVGAIVNATSVDREFRHLADLLAGDPHVKLQALFGPEHGVRGDAQYMEAVADVQRDLRTGVPVYSLYGATAESLTPTPESLLGLDALIFDVQDVGSRYYTYLATMGLALRAAARAKIAFVVLDRPNPLGLRRVEGRTVESGFESFVGQFPIPNRHGLTAGELARCIVEAERLDVELAVQPCRGLRGELEWEDLRRPFIAPSPNMPTPATARVYPGMCLLEGTQVSEGRGTCQPFEQFGAPYFDEEVLADTLNQLRLPGVHFRPVTFVPTFDKYTGEVCRGAFLHVTDTATFRPYATGLAVVAVLRELGGAKFAWRTDAYEFVEDIPAFDLLCGSARVREALERGTPLAEILDAETSPLPDFLEGRARWALYES